jgi:hypothetical protein
VFVVHGRNAAARKGLFAFLRSIGLHPLEWSHALALTNQGSPYVGEVLDRAFDAAQAVVVLLTPDDIAFLRPEYADGRDDAQARGAGQARPNVLFEAGMAMGRAPNRTILVEFGTLRPFSDVAGRLAIRLRDTVASRQELAERLRIAGCAVDLSGTDWHDAGDFASSPDPAPRRSSNGRAVQEVMKSGTGPVVLGNWTVRRDDLGTHLVHGEATNIGTCEHSAVLGATFYGEDGRIIGTATGAVSQLAAGDTKTFTLTTTDDITGFADLKVQVQAAF